MSSRFSQNTSRQGLFAGYPSSSTPSPAPRPSSGYGYAPSSSPYSNNDSRPASGAFSAYPSGGGTRQGGEPGPFRSATPNSRGQYSDAVLNELENQNEEEFSGMASRIKMLKGLSEAIGVEIRDSTALAEKMNSSFDSTRLRLRGTMNRMLRMAERTGVGWRVWLGFFAAVILLFWYVWLF